MKVILALVALCFGKWLADEVAYNKEEMKHILKSKQ